MNTNKILEKIKSDKIINLIKKHAETYKDYEIYIVGGAVRDFHLGEKNFDKDIIVNSKNNEEFTKKFAIELAESIKATFIPLDENNKIYRLILKDKTNYIDVASQIGESIEDDLKRRDLTINAIAINLNNYKIIDVTGGLKDLRTKKIRHINEQNFIDDPLRLLRTYRFNAILGFDIDKSLSRIITKHAQKIQQPAIERVNYELLKLFSGKFCANTLIEMDKAGLLQEILPISQELKRIPPNLHHHLDLFSHSIEVVKQIQEIYENNKAEVKDHFKKIDFGGTTRLAHLKFAGFLHDIGKPESWTIDQDTGRDRFIKHDDIGSKMSIKILKKTNFSKKQIKYISKMIKYHIYPSHVISSPELNDKIYMRFIRKMNNEVIDIIILAMADRLSARGVKITDEIVEKNISNLQSLLDFYLTIKDNLKPLPKLLSGEEIMTILNIKPSKELGNIIKTLKEAQLSGDIKTKKEAIIFIEKSQTFP